MTKEPFVASLVTIISAVFSPGDVGEKRTFSSQVLLSTCSRPDLNES
jgi:hypothetical protein